MIESGRGGDAPATRVSGVQRAQRWSRDSKLLGCRAVGAMWVVRGGGGVSTSSLSWVGLQLSSRVDVGGGR